MNPSETHPTTEPDTTAEIPLPPVNRYALNPMTGAVNPISVFETLLKQPGSLFHELQHGRTAAVAGSLIAVILICLGIYGAVAGSLTGGSQLWIAPAKIILGSALTVVICLPSLYIFMSMSGANLGLRQLTGLVLSAEGLTATLLIGFAPVIWVFSQSTDSMGFMAFLHLAFWAVATGFALRLLGVGIGLTSGANRGGLGVWMGVYVLVSLQMMTALRPILGHSETFLPEKKLFFLMHWLETLSGKIPQ